VKKPHPKREPLFPPNVPLGEIVDLLLDIACERKTYWEAITSFSSLLKEGHLSQDEFLEGLSYVLHLATPQAVRKAEKETQESIGEWWQQTDKYIRSEILRFIGARSENREKLTATFGAHEIDYEREILPLVKEAGQQFILAFATRKAASDIIAPGHGFLTPYTDAVHLITGEQSPFSPKIKKLVEEEYAWLVALQGDHRGTSLQEVTEVLFNQGGKVLSPVPSRKDYQQPVWQACAADLFLFLKGKGLSDGKAYRRIQLVFESEIPGGYPVLRPKKAMRLTVQRALKRSRE